MKRSRKSRPGNAARGAAVVLVLLLSSAAPAIAGEGDPGGGIGGTGITGFGVVQKFGSIYVNGREYAIDSGTQVVPDGAEGPRELHLGDVVKVGGIVDAHGRSAAVRIENLLAVRGIVEQVQGSELVILGQRIHVTPVTLQYEAGAASRAPATTLHSGDPVAVSALAAADGSWIAFRILREPREEIHFAVRGAIEAIGAGRVSLRLGGRDFALAGAAVPAGLNVGEIVRVDGQYLRGAASVDSVERVAPLFGTAGSLIEMSGYARVGTATHEIACNDVALQFDAASRFESGSPADIRNDVPLAVRGERLTDGSVLVRQIVLGVGPMQVTLPDPATPRAGRRGATAGAVTESARPDRPDVRERREIDRPVIERPSIERPSFQRPDIELPDAH